MLSHRERRRFTPEEYLQLEVTNENRSEDYDGEIFLRLEALSIITRS